MDELEQLYEQTDALPPVLLDRSTLQRYTVCPFQAWAVETGLTPDSSLDADTGTEIHRVIADAVGNYAENGEPLRDYLENEVLMTRPDVQPECIDGLRRSIWSIDRLLTSRHPNDVIAYQGGIAGKSSQLAWELLPATVEYGAIMPTSEIDLLLAGTTECELTEVDWKTGHKEYTSADVKDSFQFRLHAWLIFANYPDCEQLHVTVWMTRFNQLTPTVTFTPKDAAAFEGRLLMAVEARRQAFEAVEMGGEPDCWPAVERCSRCAAVLKCPRAYAPAPEIAAEPVAYAVNTMLLQEVIGKRLNALRDYVEEHGEIRDGRGFAFGCEEPKSSRRKSTSSYAAYNDPEVPHDEQAEKPENYIGDPYLAALGQEIKKGKGRSDNATDGEATS
ncbi:MAG TPA: PD-(D/E)XK nuclease family protein [Sedimentisphaerales bacterium]|nr:PD-(D/E)XK nuclease family protein [Sedimentisphaerales bacterium]